MSSREQDAAPRAYPRYAVTAHVEYAGQSLVTYQRIQNISAGGICIHTPMLEPPGTRVALIVTFPELETTFEVEGEVVWTNQDELMDMGIRFLNLDEEQQQVVTRYIELLEERKEDR